MMFYVKSKLNESTELRIVLDYHNVFTICPMCNKEHPVDITQVLNHVDADLDHIAVYCEVCTAKRMQK